MGSLKMECMMKCMKKCTWLAASLFVLAENTPALADEGVWEKVQDLLAATKDAIVLDGTQKVPTRYAGADQPLYGDWLVRHTLSDPENLNPYTSSDAGASRIMGFVFESLLRPANEPPFALEGWLATGYPVVSADKLSYTFTVRPEARFADGGAVTAADVLFSLKVVKHPEVLAPHLRNYFAAVKQARIEEDGRITFVCDEPYFRNDLMLGGFEILPRHFYDPDGLLEAVAFADLVDGSWATGPHAEGARRFAESFNRDFNRRLLGSGPYAIEDPERDVVTMQKVVLTRQKAYWGNTVDGLVAAGFVDQIVFKIINNTDAAFIELGNGNLDLYGLQPLEFKEKSWSDDFNGRFLKGVEYSDGYNYIGWNNAHPIFADRRVRQAMSHMTPRVQLVDNLLFGLGETVEGPIHKFRPEYNHDLTPYEYDVDRALDLLAEAGWDDTDGDGLLDKVIDGKMVPFRFEFLVNAGNSIRKDIALTLQYELQDIGIECQVRELDWSIFLQRVKSKEFAAVTLGWTGSLRFPPDDYQIWHSSQAEGSGSNFVSFRDPEVDRILEEYRREFDMDTRIEMYRRYQEILHAEQPYTFLWKPRTATAFSRRFRGVNWYPGGAEVREWWVQTADRLY
jgi:peptide/nickel transport system substrate-binding protein